MSDDTFRRALGVVLGHEGGVQSDPDDPGNAGGNATAYGVIQPTYDAYLRAKGLPLRSVREITHPEIVAIYRGYWDDAGCDRLPPALAVAHFDCAINCGAVTAIKLLQRAVGAVADGLLGPRTVEAVRTHPDALDDYLFERLAYYKGIAVAHPTQAKFMASWVGRCLHLRRLLKG